MIGFYAVVEAFTFGYTWIYPNVPVFLLMYAQANYMNSVIPFGTISAFIKIIYTCFSLLHLLPSGIKQASEIFVSFNRVQGFMETMNVDHNWIQEVEYDAGEEEKLGHRAVDKNLGEKQVNGEEYCLEINNADFYWLENKKNIQNNEEYEKQEGEQDDDNKKELVQSMLTIEERNTTKIHSRVFDIDQKNENKIKKTAKKSFKISNFDLKLPKNKLIFVIGKVGSGKSSFLYSLLGEMNPTLTSYRQKSKKSSKFLTQYTTQLKRSKKIAVLSQNPWILGETIQENILLGENLDNERLEDCINMACFDKDLKNMEKGLQTQVGEGGQTISGGQRTRLLLARCLYQDPDLLLLDDPLSALDINVATQIMEGTIVEKLKHKSIILCTNTISMLKFADVILVMERGEVIFRGGFDEVQENHVYMEMKEATDRQIQEDEIDDKNKGDFSLKNISEEFQFEEEKNTTPSIFKSEETSKNGLSGASTKVASIKSTTTSTSSTSQKQVANEDQKVMELFMEEDKEEGLISLSVFFKTIKYVGGPVVHILIIMSALALAMSDNAVPYSTISYFKNVNSENRYEIWSIFYLICIQGLSIIFATFLVRFSTLFASRTIHNRMAYHILHCKISQFFDRIPQGRILNRFTEDLENLDDYTSEAFFDFYTFFGFLVVELGALVLTGGSFYLMIPFNLYVVVCLKIRADYMNAKREVIRLKRVTKSPITSSLNEAIAGLVEVRAMQKENYVFKKLDYSCDENNKNNLMVNGLSGWFKAKIFIYALFMIYVPSYSYIIYKIWFNRENIRLENLVFFLVLASETVIDISLFLNMISYLEETMISVERCLHFAEIQPEEGYLHFQKEKKLNLGGRQTTRKIRRFMKGGSIEVKEVSARYPTSSVPVLKNLNFKVETGQKIGIVGRTGAGKTSLIKLFWRSLDTCQGQILVDGVDISGLDLKDLRSQIMVVSQDVSLFSGSLRENLHPKLEINFKKIQKFSKKKKKIELKKLKIKEQKIVNDLIKLGFDSLKLERVGLSLEIESDGSNLSLGEKQIISFERTVIDRKKLVILDEATAAVDLKTEERIQEVINEEFQDRTMLIIAHRVQTVLNCHKVMVLDSGQVKEFGTIPELLEIEGGMFRQIYEKFKGVGTGFDQ